jgi:hypothetical protein
MAMFASLRFRFHRHTRFKRNRDDVTAKFNDRKIPYNHLSAINLPGATFSGQMVALLPNHAAQMLVGLSVFVPQQAVERTAAAGCRSPKGGVTPSYSARQS